MTLTITHKAFVNEYDRSRYESSFEPKCCAAIGYFNISIWTAKHNHVGYYIVVELAEESISLIYEIEEEFDLQSILDEAICDFAQWSIAMRKMEHATLH